MPASVNATGTAAQGTSAVNTFDYTGQTVGAGSNRALLVGFNLANTAGDVAIGAVTVVWDPAGANQSMELVKSSVVTGYSAGRFNYLYGLVNPTSGNKTVRVSFASTTCDWAINSLDLTGADQTGGATTFAHTTSNGFDGNTAVTLTITSSTDNLTVAFVGNNSSSITYSSPSQTSFGNITGLATSIIGSYAAGAATVVHSFTASGSTSWSEVGVDVVAVAGGGSPTITWVGYIG